ncbi:hypothetical protein Tco_1081029 [Tanacetum coccineum]|uniref:Uncharacterized protein n=1 Tax=Tanacetum coccineum TaxID=301880 RepID=A0ABQ5HWJ1_9ASTR
MHSQTGLAVRDNSPVEEVTTSVKRKYTKWPQQSKKKDKDLSNPWSPEEDISLSADSEDEEVQEVRPMARIFIGVFKNKEAGIGIEETKDGKRRKNETRLIQQRKLEAHIAHERHQLEFERERKDEMKKMRLDHLKQYLEMLVIKIFSERKKDGVFDDAFGGVGDEEVVVGEGVVVTSSSLEMLTNSCLGGIMVILIFLEGFEEEALVEFTVEWCEEDEDDDRSGEDDLFN